MGLHEWLVCVYIRGMTTLRVFAVTLVLTILLAGVWSTWFVFFWPVTFVVVCVVWAFVEGCVNAEPVAFPVGDGEPVSGDADAWVDDVSVDEPVDSVNSSECDSDASDDDVVTMTRAELDLWLSEALEAEFARVFEEGVKVGIAAARERSAAAA